MAERGKRRTLGVRVAGLSMVVAIGFGCGGAEELGFASSDKHRRTILDVPEVFSGPCGSLKSAAFAPTATPDMYAAEAGWEGVTARHWLECSHGNTFLPRTRIEVFDCTVVERGVEGAWVVRADGCPALVSEVLDRGGKTAPVGETVISYELSMTEVGG